MDSVSDSIDLSAPRRSEYDTKKVRRAIVVGLVSNLLLSVVKGVSGWLGGSRAVVADAVHSLSDCVTDVAVLVGAKFWDRPPDHNHPYGHRRIETVLTVGIALVLVSVAAGLLVDAVAHLQRGNPHDGPSPVALGAALLSVVCKEWLYRWTMKIGHRFRSSALRANAWHHRSDALSSIPVVCAVAGAIFFPSLHILDAVGTLVVVVFIVQAAWKIAWPALRELCESAAPECVRDEIAEAATSIEGVQEVHQLRTRYVGSSLLVDLHVLVKGAISVADGHAIASRVGYRIRALNDVSDVVVHIEPIETASMVKTSRES